MRSGDDMVQNNRLDTDGAANSGGSANALLQPDPSAGAALPPVSGVSTVEADKAIPVSGLLDPSGALAEAERWLAVIPPSAACYRLLQLGILRRDLALLEGLLSVLRNP